jgi:hypothetical protein
MDAGTPDGPVHGPPGGGGDPVAGGAPADDRGLGLYAFLRSERTSRPAATVGGLALTLGGLLAVCLPLVNLAYFLPRLAFAPETSFALG